MQALVSFGEKSGRPTFWGPPRGQRREAGILGGIWECGGVGRPEGSMGQGMVGSQSGPPRIASLRGAGPQTKDSMCLEAALGLKHAVLDTHLRVIRGYMMLTLNEGF